ESKAPACPASSRCVPLPSLVRCGRLAGCRSYNSFPRVSREVIRQAPSDFVPGDRLEARKIALDERGYSRINPGFLSYPRLSAKIRGSFYLLAPTLRRTEPLLYRAHSKRPSNFGNPTENRSLYRRPLQPVSLDAGARRSF